jgi:hypothetical protein
MRPRRVALRKPGIRCGKARIRRRAHATLCRWRPFIRASRFESSRSLVVTEAGGIGVVPIALAIAWQALATAVLPPGINFGSSEVWNLRPPRRNGNRPHPVRKFQVSSRDWRRRSPPNGGPAPGLPATTHHILNILNLMVLLGYPGMSRNRPWRLRAAIRAGQVPNVFLRLPMTHQINKRNARTADALCKPGRHDDGGASSLGHKCGSSAVGFSLPPAGRADRDGTWICRERPSFAGASRAMRSPGLVGHALDK